MEDPALAAPAAPKPGVAAGLDLTGFTTTAAVPTPTVNGRIEREVVLIEWTDRNPANATFEGTARELLRLQHPLPQGLVTWETVIVVRKGANYGYPLREGTQSMSSTNGMGPLPEEDIIPMQVSDTVTAGTVAPAYPVAQYPHTPDSGGDAIANGFVYRGRLIPALRDKLLFGDITTGRIWYADRTALLAADDGIATTVAPLHEVQSDLRRRTEEAFRTRGGKGPSLPGMAMISGRGRVDMRFAIDDDGELYILTKSDGMIRKVVAARTVTDPAPVSGAAPAGPERSAADQTSPSVRNPVAATPESIANGSGSTTRTALSATAAARREPSRPA